MHYVGTGRTVLETACKTIRGEQKKEKRELWEEMEDGRRGGRSREECGIAPLCRGQARAG